MKKKKKSIQVKRSPSAPVRMSNPFMKILKTDLIPSIPDMVGVYIILGACMLSVIFWILLSLRTQ